MNFEGGNAGATSIHAKSHNADKAFVLQKPGNTPWANNMGQKLPQIVWYKFPQALKVGKFAFASRIDCCLKQSPRSFEFVGSNDCKHWKSLLSINTQFTKKAQEKVWTIPKDNRQTFSCFGIRVTKVSSGPFAAIQNFKMWMEGKRRKDF